MSSTICLFRICIFALVVFIAGCMVQPTEVADGGTHTGNPDISAAVDAVRQLYNAVDEQQVEKHLDTSALNPTALLEQSSQNFDTRMLAKKMQTISPASRDTIYIIDTLLITDTTYIHDTLVSRTVRKDTTVRETDDGQEELIVERSIVDSVIVYDTILAMDSLFLVDTIVTRDSFFDGENQSPVLTAPGSVNRSYKLVSANQNYVYTVLSADSLMHVFEYEGDTVFLSVSPDKYNITFEAVSNIQQLEKNLIRGDAHVHTLYRDQDGDSLLFMAQQGWPHIMLTQKLDSAGYVTSKTVVFDHGLDFNFSTISDNTVRSFSGHTVYLQDTVFHVAWDMSEDSGSLSVMHRQPTDSLYKLERQYRYVIRQEQPFFISKAHQLMMVRIGEVYAIEVELVPSVQWTPTQKPEKASVRVTMQLKDGSLCEVNGTVEHGVFSGTWLSSDGSEKVIEKIDLNQIP